MTTEQKKTSKLTNLSELSEADRMQELRRRINATTIPKPGKLSWYDRIQVADAKKRVREEAAARGIKRQRPNYLAKGQRHTY